MEKQISAFSRQILIRMKAQLESIALESPETLTLAVKSSCVIRECLTSVKDFVCSSTFIDKQEEIEFFKFIKPDFVSYYQYYERIIKLKLNEPFEDNDTLRQYYVKKLRLLQQAKRANPEFYKYCLTQESSFDSQYFTRENNSPGNPDYDNRFCTSHDLARATILSNHMLKDYIEGVINKFDNPDHSNPALQWTGSKTDLVELIYALHSAEVLNKGKADIKMVATTLENLLHVSLGNYYRGFQEIRLRKKSQTSFLDELKLKLIQRMESNLE